MTNQELYRQLRALGFSAEQAIAEISGQSDMEYETVSQTVTQPMERRKDDRHPMGRNGRFKIAVSMPQRGRRGPVFEYFAKPVRKGQKVTVAAGNNEVAYKALSRKAMSIPQLAAATGIGAHSLESSVYRLRTAGLVDKRPIGGK